ncbi:MAG: DUF6090 family protein [Cellulophaga sp.]|nr:DUF6090 family protein [Cellulophaga sp.]
MIKLFRNIRQNLLSEGKTSKYFKYAIGEIVLVVIGILIALQINNWNIERIERKSETSILLDLQVEFEENLKDAERVYEGNKIIYDAVTALQHNFSEPNLSQRKLDTLMYNVFDWFDYTPRPGASENLINSGNLSLIKNNELRKLLTFWSGVEAELDDDEALAIRYSQDIILPFLAEIYPFGNLEAIDNTIPFYQERNSNLLKWKVQKRQDVNILLLLENKTFQSHLSAKKMYAKHNIVECANVVNSCQAILTIIAHELQKND